MQFSCWQLRDDLAVDITQQVLQLNCQGNGPAAVFPGETLQGLSWQLPQDALAQTRWPSTDVLPVPRVLSTCRDMDKAHWRSRARWRTA